MKMKRLFVLFCFLFLLITLYAGKPVRKDKILYSCSYMRMDDFTEKEFWLTKCCPRVSGEIVKSTESAAMLAYVYAQNLFGEDIAKLEQPYHVSLVNDSIWCVSGSSKKISKKRWKGNFVMAIDKKSGSLLAYMHEK